MISQLSLTQDQYDDMLRHVTEHMPLEACGLLAGRNGRVRKVLPVRNQAQSPVRFVMDPYEVVHLVWSRAEGNGVWKVRGFWIQDGQTREVDLSIGK